MKNNIWIPKAKERVFKMSDRDYVGANPVFKPRICVKTGMLLGYNKVEKGVPFRRKAKSTETI